MPEGPRYLLRDRRHAPRQAGQPPLPDRGDELQKIGVFAEMGGERVAFDETLAKNSIGSQGYYRFQAKTFSPVAEWPLAMP